MKPPVGCTYTTCVTRAKRLRDVAGVFVSEYDLSVHGWWYRVADAQVLELLNAAGVGNDREAGDRTIFPFRVLAKVKDDETARAALRTARAVGGAVTVRALARALVGE